MTSIPNYDTIPPSIRSKILTRLREVETQHDVTILHAVESGSRAWGFPSPDSDYDVRFFYIRKRDYYLSLSSQTDVIECDITDEIDLNGWDIRKALMKLAKTNATAIEWMQSPIQYRTPHPIIQTILNLTAENTNPRALWYNYTRTGIKSQSLWLNGTPLAVVEKYFYSLQLALSARCVRQEPHKLPPMNLQLLVEAADLSQSVRQQIDQLVSLKAQTNEKTNIVRLRDVDDFIDSELHVQIPPPKRDSYVLPSFNLIFRDLVNGL